VTKIMKKILVVGGAGYIGGALTDRLIDYKFRVYDNLLYDNIYRKPVDFFFGDIRETSKLKKQLEWADVVIWLAAIVGDPACNLNQDLAVEINERSVKWLCKNYDGKIIFLSTCSVYGVNDKLLHEESELNPLSLYAWTKLNSEKYLEKKNAIIFRLGTVYGLSDIYSRLRMDLVVNILTTHAQKLNKITVYGGEQHRPLIHVKDIALAIEKVVDLDATGVFNLHSLNTTVKNIADTVKTHFPNLTIETTGVKFQDNRSYRVSSEKAQ
ncbi:uncharacterized protein METZ01_LOCUS321928, partial [marine metagenome]